jgi:hypothetical protein
MLDPVEREAWFNVYLEEGLAFAPLSERPYVAAWARSMSKIAEQFIPNDDAGEVEQPEYA